VSRNHEKGPERGSKLVDNRVAAGQLGGSPEEAADEIETRPRPRLICSQCGGLGQIESSWQSPIRCWDCWGAGEHHPDIP